MLKSFQSVLRRLCPFARSNGDLTPGATQGFAGRPGLVCQGTLANRVIVLISAAARVLPVIRRAEPTLSVKTGLSGQNTLCFDKPSGQSSQQNSHSSRRGRRGCQAGTDSVLCLEVTDGLCNVKAATPLSAGGRASCPRTAALRALDNDAVTDLRYRNSCAPPNKFGSSGWSPFFIARPRGRNSALFRRVEE